MLMPSQYADMLPATNPDRMFSDAPPSRDEITTSFTCADSVEVNAFTSSGMTAPASVPQEMMLASFHHSVPSLASCGMTSYDARYVSAIEITDVSQTSELSGAS